MTLTYPILNRARRILWLVTGGEKAGMLLRLCNGDPSIPAGRVSEDAALILADRAAAEQLQKNGRRTACTAAAFKTASERYRAAHFQGTTALPSAAEFPDQSLAMRICEPGRAINLNFDQADS
jgi:hypothetical protein